jgi:hypothetical protein
VQEIPNINGEVNVAFMRISETLLGIFIVHGESSVVLSRLDRVYRRYTDVRSEEATLTHKFLREFPPVGVADEMVYVPGIESHNTLLLPSRIVK